MAKIVAIQDTTTYTPTRQKNFIDQLWKTDYNQVIYCRWGPCNENILHVLCHTSWFLCQQYTKFGGQKNQALANIQKLRILYWIGLDAVIALVYCISLTFHTIYYAIYIILYIQHRIYNNDYYCITHFSLLLLVVVSP